MNLKPLNDSIIFEFLDEITDGHFVTKTSFGLVLPTKNIDMNANLPRWGKVYAIGPDVKDVSVNDLILITPLRWTDSFKFEGKRYCKTIEKEILGIAEEIDDLSQLKAI